MPPIHKLQRGHDLVIDYETLARWVLSHCGIRLPHSKDAVQIEAASEPTGGIALTWNEDWAVQALDVPIRSAEDRDR